MTTKDGLHFKRYGGLEKMSRDWYSIRHSFSEIEKLQSAPFADHIPFIKYIRNSDTWKKLDIKVKEEMIRELALDSERKKQLNTYLCTH
jgi:hypothetical protein